jgi:tight adherence protein B
VTAVVVVLCALGFSLGIILVVTAWTSAPEPQQINPTSFALQPAVIRVGAAMIGALIAFVLTGWIVVLGAGAIGGWKVAGWWLSRGEHATVEQERIEALAAWCEQLRDLLEANEGPMSTIQATVAICPVAIRPEVARLANRMQRQDPQAALDEFAAELADPSGDLVASVLGHAMSTSGKTAELLSELAATITERANMRLRVEADRSGQRSEGRIVIATASIVMGAIVLFGRNTTFLRAYDGSTGQLALAIIAALFIGGVWWLNRLTRFDEPARFLTIGRRR